ncbi:hypothetical protein C3L33_19460, partial [Rhododendron williamsianum]
MVQRLTPVLGVSRVRRGPPPGPHAVTVPVTATEAAPTTPTEGGAAVPIGDLLAELPHLPWQVTTTVVRGRGGMLTFLVQSTGTSLFRLMSNRCPGNDGMWDMPKKRGGSVKLMLQTDLCGRKVRGCSHKFQVCGLIVVVGKSFRSHITNCGRKLGSAADKSYGILVNALFMGLRFQHEMNSSS